MMICLLWLWSYYAHVMPRIMIIICLLLSLWLCIVILLFLLLCILLSLWLCIVIWLCTLLCIFLGIIISIWLCIVILFCLLYCIWLSLLLCIIIWLCLLLCIWLCIWLSLWLCIVILLLARWRRQTQCWQNRPCCSRPTIIARCCQHCVCRRQNLGVFGPAYIRASVLWRFMPIIMHLITIIICLLLWSSYAYYHDHTMHVVMLIIMHIVMPIIMIIIICILWWSYYAYDYDHITPTTPLPRPLPSFFSVLRTPRPFAPTCYETRACACA